MTDTFKAAQEAERYEIYWRNVNYNQTDIACGYNPKDVIAICSLLPNEMTIAEAQGLPQTTQQPQSRLSQSPQTAGGIGGVGDSITFDESAVGFVDDKLLKAIREEYVGKPVLSVEERTQKIREDQERFYSKLNEKTKEAEKKFNVSTDRASQKGFIPATLLRQAYDEETRGIVEPTAVPDPLGFEELDYETKTYEELLVAIKQLDMSSLTSAQKQQLVRILELKAVGGDAGVIVDTKDLH